MNTITLELRLSQEIYQALQQAAAQEQKTEAEFALAILQTCLNQLSQTDPLLGLFTDEKDLIDKITTDAMADREKMTLRLSETGNG